MTAVAFPLVGTLKTFVDRLGAFAKEQGASLDLNGLIDIAGHVYSDEYPKLHTDQQWHVARFNRVDFDTAEDLIVEPSQVGALAAVYDMVIDIGMDPEVIIEEGQLTVECDGVWFAKISPIEYEDDAPEDAVRRFETLLSGIAVMDERAFLAKLLKIPVWKVELYDSHHGTFPDKKLPELTCRDRVSG